MNKDLEKIHKEIERYREKIKYDTVDYPIESICRRFENKKIIIPDYQREFVWTIDKQSKLIESILMGFPIPFLFFYEDKDKGILEVVDGAQRLQSVYFFLENKLKLEGLKKLKSLNNCYFNDLPEKFKNKFENTALRVILLEEKTNNEIILKNEDTLIKEINYKISNEYLLEFINLDIDLVENVEKSKPKARYQ